MALDPDKLSKTVEEIIERLGQSRDVVQYFQVVDGPRVDADAIFFEGVAEGGIVRADLQDRRERSVSESINAVMV